jgi:SAM-dependent methyltransferase
MVPYVQQKVRWYSQLVGGVRTLEIGSYDVNGGVRQWFTDYTGIDMREGPGVDYVCNSHLLTTFFGFESFDVVLWLETIEHDSAWWKTREQIDNVLKPEGYFIASTPGLGMPVHEFPSDYWRFTPDGFKRVFEGYVLLDFDVENDGEGRGIPVYIGCGRKAANGA